MDPARSCVDHALAGALEETPGRVAAYIFGGAAIGRVHKDSDLDVAVLLAWAHYPDRRARFDARLRLIAELGAVLHRNDVDLVIQQIAQQAEAGPR